MPRCRRDRANGRNGREIRRRRGHGCLRRTGGTRGSRGAGSHAALAMQRRLQALFAGDSRFASGSTPESGGRVPQEGGSFVTGDAVNVCDRLQKAATRSRFSRASEPLRPRSARVRVREVQGRWMRRVRLGGVACRRFFALCRHATAWSRGRPSHLRGSRDRARAASGDLSARGRPGRAASRDDRRRAGRRKDTARS